MSEAYTVKALSPLRKVIAARMTEAKRSIPHFRLVADIEMNALLGAREEVNRDNSHPRITVNDCVIKACAGALSEHPEINCQFVGEEIHQYSSADISVVIAVDGGVSTPVIRAADRKNVHEIGAEVRELAARATTGRLKMSEIVGGSFSISNLGAHDIVQFDAIINPPQCAILALGRVKPRMMVGDTGDPRLAMVARATLSLDHRVIDGITGAAFLMTLQQVLKQPERVFGLGSTKPC